MSFGPTAIAERSPLCFRRRELGSAGRHPVVAAGISASVQHRCARRGDGRRGEGYDVVVFALPPGMASIVCRELAADRQEWRDMITDLSTVATQAFQLWSRADERTLGWERTGSTLTGYVKPFDTWSSLPQLIDADDWPPDDRPRAVAYFCGTLAAPPPGDGPSDPGFAQRPRDAVRARAVRFLSEDVDRLLPGACRDGAFRWDLLCGSDGTTGPAALDIQYWVANVDTSDRYVQSLAEPTATGCPTRAATPTCTWPAAGPTAA
jgi:hypothetical protein